MNKKIIIAFVIVFAGIFLYAANIVLQEKSIVENYIRAHISEISPEKEVLGGKFYITQISFSSHNGIVDYEDGHNSFRAAFEYAVNIFGRTMITHFHMI